MDADPTTSTEVIATISPLVLSQRKVKLCAVVTAASCSEPEAARVPDPFPLARQLLTAALVHDRLT
jgi:hypothetical protein